MSLWEKWEREKLEKQGIEAGNKHDVIIRKMHIKSQLGRQIWIVIGAFFACLLVVYVALTLEAVFNGRRWSDTYIVRLFVERAEQRSSISDSP